MPLACSSFAEPNCELPVGWVVEGDPTTIFYTNLNLL